MRAVSSVALGLAVNCRKANGDISGKRWSSRNYGTSTNKETPTMLDCRMSAPSPPTVLPTVLFMCN